MRVAIVGGGPRGLWAAEALLGAVGGSGTPLDVDVWDDRPLGFGSAYRRDQPDYWRLNVSSAIVRSSLGPLDDWRRRRGEADPLDPFPSRSVVGGFLGASWGALQSRVPAGGSLSHVHRRAASVEPDGDGWRVDGVGYDEVLLATGHADDWPGALQRDWARPVHLVPHVHPRLLREGDVPPGSRVALRGAALTFIDAALHLTEGRGGRFEHEGAHLAYVPSGREPAVLWPTSRNGRFMEVKPQPGSPLAAVAPQPVVDEGSEALRRATTLSDVRNTLDRTARAFLAAAGADARDSDVDAVLAGTDGSDALADLRRSLDVAAGLRGPGAAWAVGEAWRRLYPALVDRVSFGGLVELDGFDELAATLERVAFGPPVVNAAKIVALADAGLVDVQHLAAPDDAYDRADVVVDAVIAPAGVVPGTLAAGLVERGIGRVAPGARGLLIERDGTVVGAAHLAAVGRDTEDVTLGNDTLSRTLHDVVDRWAARVAARARGDAGETP